MSTGVPSVPYNNAVHDFINLDPTYHARRLFKRNFFKWGSIGGLLYAFYFTNPFLIRNEWYTRPDLKPFPAMVPQESLSESDKIIMETYYKKYRAEKEAANRKNSTWYRVLFPNAASYDVESNPYVGSNGRRVYNPLDTRYESHTSTGHFRDHLNSA